MAPVTCANCGARVPAGAAFCPKCGTATAAAVSKAVPKAPKLTRPGKSEAAAPGQTRPKRASSRADVPTPVPAPGPAAAASDTPAAASAAPVVPAAAASVTPPAVPPVAAPAVVSAAVQAPVSAAAVPARVVSRAELPPGATVLYAYPVASSAEVAQAMPHKSRNKLFLVLGGGVALFVLTLFGVGQLVGPGPVQQVCTPVCPPPNPARPPLGAPHTYTSTRFGYQLDYSDGVLTKYGKMVVNSDSSIGWVIGYNKPAEARGINFPITFSAEPAAGRNAHAVVMKDQADHFPNAQLAYQIPGAELGYNDAYGAVYDVNLASANGGSLRSRLVMITAVKGGVAVNLVAVGPYVRSVQGPGHPNPADTPIVYLFEDMVNTVRFRGDRSP